jgi:hypothetical protein
VQITASDSCLIGQEHIMTTTLVWTGVALWIGFCVFVVFGPTAGPVRIPARSTRFIGHNRYRA